MKFKPFIQLSLILLLSGCGLQTDPVGSVVAASSNEETAFSTSPSSFIEPPEGPYRVEVCTELDTIIGPEQMAGEEFRYECWEGKKYCYELIENANTAKLAAEAKAICEANNIPFNFSFALARPIIGPKRVAYIWSDGRIRFGYEFYKNVQGSPATQAWVLCHEISHDLLRDDPDYMLMGSVAADPKYQFIFDRYDLEERREIAADFRAISLYLKRGYTIEDIEASMMKVSNVHHSLPCGDPRRTHPCSEERVYLIWWYIGEYFPELKRD